MATTTLHTTGLVSLAAKSALCCHHRSGCCEVGPRLLPLVQSGLTAKSAMEQQHHHEFSLIQDSPVPQNHFPQGSESPGGRENPQQTRILGHSPWSLEQSLLHFLLSLKPVPKPESTTCNSGLPTHSRVYLAQFLCPFMRRVTVTIHCHLYNHNIDTFQLRQNTVCGTMNKSQSPPRAPFG